MLSQQALSPDFYEVERLLQRGQCEGQRYYLVKWKGFSDDEATWEPESNLGGCKRAITDFERIMKVVESQDLLNKSALISKKGRPFKKDQIKRKIVHVQYTDVLQASADNEAKKDASQAGETKGKSRLEANSQKSKDFSLDSKNKVSRISKAKRSKKSFESSLETSQSNELEATTAQTVPSSSKTQRVSNKDLATKSQQIKLQKVPDQQLEVKECLKLDHNKMMNIQLDEKAIQAQKTNSFEVTERTQRVDSFKRDSTVQNTPAIGEVEETEDKTTKKRILSLSQEPIIIQDHKKEGLARKTDFKITNQISELCVSFQPKKEEQKTEVQGKKDNQQLINGQLKTLDIQPALSHRQKLCQEEFQEFVFEMCDLLLPNGESAKNFMKINDCSKNLVKLSNYYSNFINLTTSEFLGLNDRLFSQILSKESVSKMDEEGEFLYSKIERLIKGIEMKDGVATETWISVLMDWEKEVIPVSENRKVYLVRVDDLEAGLWKKLFRRFTMKKQK